ncbi:hypothetical protein SAMN05443579_10963 [Variovorax sp. PDC80]|uniref:hypothetical protein n=1 Tax=Variovorax sp. PDC80 TaxID=1882827 RepID=UPI0008F02D52|nr:hypothetical protein [Variovorax sp. PDC80]SFP17643.1 hypothetical protein SAMN05443579_10963 [Variovorax sp. PDC80]
MALWKREIDWMNEAAQRIGCCGIAEWLAGFAAWAQLAPTGCPPAGLAARADYASASNGLRVALVHPFADRVAQADPQAWVLYDLQLDAAALPLPFGLDARGETPPGARRKLSADTAFGRPIDLRDGNHRIVHYLPDGRVVGVIFKPAMVGIEGLHLQRLGAMPDFRTLATQGATP